LDEIPKAVDAAKLVSLCQLVHRFKPINYSKKRAITSATVEQFLNSHGYLAPVETDP